MHELSQRSYPSDGILSVYDLILIPKWVMEEIEDSTYRSTYGTAGLTVHIQGRRFRDYSSNRQDKILPEAAYSRFHPEREPDETHHAGISDSRWHSHNWHFYLRCVLELPRYTPPS